MAGLGLVQNTRDYTPVSVEELQRLFPAKKGTITDETADLINQCMEDPEFQGSKLVDSLVTYEKLMNDNSASMTEYVNAIKFCAYLEGTDDSYVEAYKRTFHHRKFVADRYNAVAGTTQYNELSSAASRFRKSRLVVSILTMADVPLYLMFQGARYQAVQVLADMMMTAKYDKDRINAADKLLANVKPPENLNIELEVGMNQEAKSMQEQLNEQLMTVAANQKKMLDAGMKITDIQKLSIDVNEIEDAEVLDG